MKKIVCAMLVVCMMLLCFVSCGNNKYNEFAGEYFSGMGGEGSYHNCPTTIVFEKDGTGFYFWRGTRVDFTYEIDNNNHVSMFAYGFVSQNGTFSGSSYKLDNYSITYTKRSNPMFYHE